MTSAATPDGIRCCAQASPPWPPRKSAPPKMNAATICGRPIRSRGPFMSPQARRIAPATRWRPAIVRNGGIVRTASSIAAKVDPQTT